MFEGQMRMLKHHQALEEQKLLLSGSHAIHDNDIASALSHGLAPGSRLNNGSLFSGVSLGTPQSAFHSPANATEKRKSVNYADYTEYTTYSPNASATHAHTVTMPSVSQFGSHTHIAGAKSMPGLRRGSGNHGNLPGINLQGLSIRDGSSTTGQAGQGGILKNGAGGIFGPTASQPSKGFNPGFLLDKELDKELSRHESVNFLPLSSEDDSRSLLRSDSYSKLSASSAALALAPLSQTPPCGPGPNGRMDPALKSSKWPRFSGAPCPSDAIPQTRIRNATNPGPIGGSRPLRQCILNALAKSVPATPMSSRQSVGSLAGKPVGLGGGDVASFAQDPNGSFNMNCLSGAYDAPVTFNPIQGNEENFVGNTNGEMNGAAPRTV
ncbi:pumilio homology domain family member 4 [Ceratobasidium sp. AG-Ba]|nr:pumilio homology domain family member 4 [Ceratobasidium sp. AG-Ba]